MFVCFVFVFVCFCLFLFVCFCCKQEEKSIMADDEQRQGMYDAIRALMRGEVNEAQFRKRVEKLRVPMTSGLFLFLCFWFFVCVFLFVLFVLLVILT